jgi:hypothetical protein
MLIPESAWLGVRGRLAGAWASIPWRTWAWLAVGALPSIAFFFAYNQLRFGTALESGYALATLPEWLEAQRQKGLFSLAHVPMNLDYLFLHLPQFPPPLGDSEAAAEFPFFRPDGLGLSVLITSPGLLFAARADWRRPWAWLLLGAAVFVLIPTLLYYGGGWLQYGYRYFLDSIPFIWALCAMAAAYRGRIGMRWRLLIFLGLVVMAFAPHFAYRI